MLRIYNGANAVYDHRIDLAPGQRMRHIEEKLPASEVRRRAGT